MYHSSTVPWNECRCTFINEHLSNRSSAVRQSSRQEFVSWVTVRNTPRFALPTARQVGKGLCTFPKSS